MTIYKQIRYWGELSALQDDAFRLQVESAFKRVERDNLEIYHKAVAQHTQLIALALEIYGDKSSVIKYLRSKPVERPKSAVKEFNKLMRQFDIWLAAERQRQQRREYEQRRKETVKTLESLGYVAGKHFSRSRAITFAKQVLVEVAPGVYSNRMLPAPGETSEEN